MTMQEATQALSVPASVANNNCVQDAQWRLRERLALAGRFHAAHEPAPSYVTDAAGWLRSWVLFAEVRDS